MRKSGKFVQFVYLFLVFFLSLYSYSLLDPNLTLVRFKLWTVFRNFMVNWGYFHRSVNSLIFLFLTVCLSFTYFLLFNFKFKKADIFKLTILIGLITFFSYPFLSHDFFNYLFDAKILTVYHQNPYLHKALDFPADPWLRFMHWTHRRYPYGPLFLAITAIPSFLSFGKFFLSYFLFKLVWLGAYIISVYLLVKLKKEWALIFATNPLVIIEGLINLHNDFIAVFLGIVGIYFLLKKNRNLVGKLFFLFSAGIKYITFPILLISEKKKTFTLVAFLGVAGVLAYLSFYKEVQPWYFLNLLIFLPFFEGRFRELWVFWMGLVLSYYPYVRFGGWDKFWKVEMKHEIILSFLLFQLAYSSILFLKRKRILNLGKSIKTKKEKIVLLSVVLFIGILHLLIIFPSGSFFCLRGRCGIFFWGAHEHDAIWHLALAKVSFNHLPFILPNYFGETLKGYNYFLDLIIFFFYKLGIPPLFTYFKLIPLIWVLSFIFLVIKVAEKINKSKLYLYSLMIFSLLGTSFSYFFNLYHYKTIWNSAGGMGMESLQALINPQYALSLFILFLIILLILNRHKYSFRRYVVLLSILVAINTALKFYAGIISIFLIFLNFSFTYLLEKKRSIKNFLISNAVLILFFAGVIIVFYKPFESFHSGSVLSFKPFALVNRVIEEPSRFYLKNMVLARYYLLQTGRIGLRLIFIEGLSLLLYVFFAFGVKFFGLLFFIYKLLKRKVSSLEIQLFLTVLLGITLMSLFVQKGQWWNTIQFLHYSVFLSTFFLAELMVSIYSSDKTIGIIIFSLFILLILPPNLDLIRIFTSSKTPSYIPVSEVKALRFLREQRAEVVLSPLYDESIRLKRGNPRPLFLSVDSCYPAAFTGKVEYLSDLVQLQLIGVDYSRRLKMIKENVCKILPSIDYIYDQRNYFNKKKLEDCSIPFKQIYYDDGIVIYKIYH